MTTLVLFTVQFLSPFLSKLRLYTALFLGWLMANQAKVRLAVFIFTLSLMVLAIAAPGLKTLADDAGGGGGH